MLISDYQTCFVGWILALLCIISQFSLPQTTLEMAAVERLLQIPEDAVPCKIRAKRGCATHPRSIAERVNFMYIIACVTYFSRFEKRFCFLLLVFSLPSKENKNPLGSVSCYFSFLMRKKKIEKRKKQGLL